MTRYFLIELSTGNLVKTKEGEIIDRLHSGDIHNYAWHLLNEPDMKHGLRLVRDYYSIINSDDYTLSTGPSGFTVYSK